jgi:hypothetical protein
MGMSFEDERKDYIEKLKNIINGIDKINAMQNTRIIDAKMQSELEKKKRDAQKFLKKLEQREFEIAVVGLEKAGKSSFSNAILEIDVLPTADARCTYTSTCIRAGESDRATIRFFSVDEFNGEFCDKLKTMGIENVSAYTYNTLSKDTYLRLFEALPERDQREYTDSVNQDVLDIIQNRDILSQYIGYADKQYIGSELDSDEFKDFIRKPEKAIAAKEIVIESTKFNSMKNAVMYDVPGFDSPTAMHKQQTLSKMRDVDAIIMVANAKAPSLRGTEISIFKENDLDGALLSEKLFVFENKVDMINDTKALEENKATAWKEWIEIRKIMDRKDRIIFGSAIAYLGEKLGKVGLDARAKMDELGMPYGVDELKKELEKYYEKERFVVLKKRIDSIISTLQEMFRDLKAEKKGSFSNGAFESTAYIRLTFEIADSGKLIQSDLKVLKESINEKERELKLSKAIDAKISELVTVENCKITEEELKETHRDKAGNGTMQNPSAVEPAIRQLKFNKMYEDFQEEIFNIAAEEHESNFKEIVEIFKTRFGLSDRNACSDALIENICEFIDGRSTKDSADGQGKAYFSSLIERFARDIYEILILKTRGQDRYNQFRDRVENYLSMGVFYSAKKASLVEDDQFSYIDAKLSDSPMWKLLLWPELLNDCEEVDTNRVWETLKNLTGIEEGDYTSIDRLINASISRYGKSSVELVKKIFTGFVKSRPEMELVRAAREILREYVVEDENEEENKTENEDLRDIIYGRAHVKRSIGKEVELNYESIQEEFKADILVLNEVLRYAFIGAINMDRAFSANEVGFIERLIKKLDGPEFKKFTSDNLWLIKHDEMSSIADEKAKQDADRVVMEQIDQILTALNHRMVVE